ncbi:hypothetical protein PHSY_001749 [Pseudozyma hubeiensis SY62]|uniref:Uncharacterized protein n=1 Tax=Pseudozyma hubeiensis (strain SY62) TaxID=1305764 RepID=R9NZA0_PSEHS|nr:hypothetical protein PHSY_001749 [Pseudozyma hubeiensis SY62]GAC94178.1 hypothetical protein PHSY_001749 [Pseudozyma hubeiensis SY62]
MATAKKLIQTTPVVAKVLSGDLRVRSGYEVINVDTRIESWPETPSIKIKGSTEAAVALRSFFAKQNGERKDNAARRVVMPTIIELGDIVEAHRGPPRIGNSVVAHYRPIEYIPYRIRAGSRNGDDAARRSRQQGGLRHPT